MMKESRGGSTGGGGGGGGGRGSPSAHQQQHVTFSVLNAYEDQRDDERPTPGRGWRPLIALLTLLGLLALAASTALLARPSAASSVVSSSSSSKTATAEDHDRLVSELGLNATQALLLDASRLRAYLDSPAWRERKEAAWGEVERQSGSSSRRGVVIPAGGRDHLLNALVTVRYLRRLGCRLPVEVVHYGGAEVGQEQSDDDRNNNNKKKEASSARKAAAALALEPGVRLVDASRLIALPQSPLRRDLAPLHRFAMPHSFGKKVFAAAYASSFREILLLDGDALPLIDPSPLFEAPDYKNAGSMFWPDFWHNAWTDVKLWRALGVVPPWDRDEYADEEEGEEGDDKGGNRERGERAGRRQTRRWRHRLVESGQLLLDRRRHADVLEWAWLLNGPNREVVYKAMHGDKDTWRLAFDLAGKSGGGYHYKNAAVAENGGDGGQQKKDGGGGGDEGGYFHLVPHMARDVMREGPAGHAHGWHHVGVLQAAPRGVPAVLEAAAKAAAEEAAGGGDATVVASLRKRGEEAFGRAIAAAKPSSAEGGEASGGWPFFLHRTSFNAKFFPDCARRKGDEEEEAKGEEEEGGGDGKQPRRRPRRSAFYCRPTHASVPLSDEQAARALKPHMYAFDAPDVEDTSSSSSSSSSAPPPLPRLARCLARLAENGEGVSVNPATAASADSPGVAAMLLAGAEAVETRCAPEGLGARSEEAQHKARVQVFSIDAAWPYVARGIDVSVDVYWQVRRAFWEAD